NNLPVLLDEGGAVTKKYGIRFYPSAALIDTEGNVKMLRPGHMNKESLAMEMKGIS
ncbi:MAG: TlpA family protein disulfide reductase, partial [Dialister invisus]|nr:TlpA family protein disulfide reductase [Dialister invisus]